MLAETKSTDFVITRVFDAPREVLWKCFTEPESMKEWFGPKGSVVVASKMDLRVGGTYHGAMRAANGTVAWAKFVYREIVAPQRLVWVHSFSDEAGGLTRHPMAPTWPLQMLTTVIFEDAPGGERSGKTKLTLRWSPLDVSAEEQATFDAAHDSMRGGWTGSFERLDAYLASPSAR
ncbi:MAG TPA: SRPBCC domain-containing protein [Xanthobacteraceae bacterium]|nr:SRPBCC domain-containing protein [Xanthobacteraceae bacterium]